MKQKNILLILLLSVCYIMSSCDKQDCNNGLDGQWQMYEWQAPEGELVGGKEMQIYYSFQLQMMMFQKLSVSSGYLLSSFENRNTSILIYDPIKYKANGHDEILPMDTLRQYGVPFDGMMKIDRLSGDTLILHSRETGRLCFKRY